MMRCGRRADRARLRPLSAAAPGSPAAISCALRDRSRRRRAPAHAAARERSRSRRAAAAITATGSQWRSMDEWSGCGPAPMSIRAGAAADAPSLARHNVAASCAAPADRRARDGRPEAMISETIRPRCAVAPGLGARRPASISPATARFAPSKSRSLRRQTPSASRGRSSRACRTCIRTRFQRALAGLTERGGPGADNFWTWRTEMYRFLERIGPDEAGGRRGAALPSSCSKQATRASAKVSLCCITIPPDRSVREPGRNGRAHSRRCCRDR